VSEADSGQRVVIAMPSRYGPSCMIAEMNPRHCAGVLTTQAQILKLLKRLVQGRGMGL